MAIIRWRPFNGLEQVFQELQALQPSTNELATDVYEEGNNVIVEIQVAGIRPDKVDISVEGDNLRVRGSREEIYETEDRDYYTKEIRRGDFERIIQLPAPVLQEQARAAISEGVLEIVLPKRGKEQEHKIPIEQKQKQAAQDKEQIKSSRTKKAASSAKTTNKA